MPKIENCKIFGCPTFSGRPLYTQVTTVNLHLFIKISYIIHIQCHVNHMEMEKRSNIHLKLTSDRQGQIFALILNTCMGYSLFHMERLPEQTKDCAHFLILINDFLILENHLLILINAQHLLILRNHSLILRNHLLILRNHAIY